MSGALPAKGVVWIVYDGRAESGDTDEASVMEACGNGWKDLRAALWTWRGYDAVLAEYDFDGKDATNERIIGHMREGRKALLAKCTRPGWAVWGNEVESNVQLVA
jgi:hypothetical protein